MPSPKAGHEIARECAKVPLCRNREFAVGLRLAREVCPAATFHGALPNLTPNLGVSGWPKSLAALRRRSTWCRRSRLRSESRQPRGQSLSQKLP